MASTRSLITGLSPTNGDIPVWNSSTQSWDVMSIAEAVAASGVQPLLPSTPYDADDRFAWITADDNITGQGGTVGALNEYNYQPNLPNRVPGGASATLAGNGTGPYFHTGSNLFGGPVMGTLQYDSGGWIGGAGTTQPTANWSASIWYRPWIKATNPTNQILFGRSKVANPNPATAADWSWYFYDSGLGVNDPRASVGFKHKRDGVGTFDSVSVDPTGTPDGAIELIRQPVVQTWRHLHASFDGTSLYFRVNGLLVNFFATAGITDVDNTNGIFMIGRGGAASSSVYGNVAYARLRAAFDTPAYVAGEYLRGAAWGA